MDLLLISSPKDQKGQGVRLPISPSYDLAHLAEKWLDSGKNRKLAKNPLGWLDGQCVQGAGTYSPLEFTALSRIGFFEKEALMTSDY